MPTEMSAEEREKFMEYFVTAVVEPDGIGIKLWTLKQGRQIAQAAWQACLAAQQERTQALVAELERLRFDAAAAKSVKVNL